MTNKWSPDTCGCVVEYEGQPTGDPIWVKSIKKCQYPPHKNSVGAAHLSLMLVHNRSYNRKYPSEELTIPQSWKDELAVRGQGVDQKKLAELLGRNDIIIILDKADEILGDKRNERERIKILGKPIEV